MALSFLISLLFVTIYSHGVDCGSSFPFYTIKRYKLKPMKAQYNSLTASKLFSYHPAPEFIFLFIYLFILFFILHAFLCDIVALPRLRPKCNSALSQNITIQLFFSLPKQREKHDFFVVNFAGNAKAKQFSQFEFLSK